MSSGTPNAAATEQSSVDPEANGNHQLHTCRQSSREKIASTLVSTSSNQASNCGYNEDNHWTVEPRACSGTKKLHFAERPRKARSTE
jgi:hypothetical protein